MASLKHLIAHWDEDLPRLDAAGLQERWELAQERENDADAPGTGRNPKARRDWRKRRQAVEAALERRRAADTDWFRRLTLDEIRRRVVSPVVASLIRPDELDDVSLWWGRPERPEPADPWFAFSEREPWVRVTACGETCSSNLWSTHNSDVYSTVSDVAHAFALRLEDWVYETRFAWGQQRIAHYDA